MTNIIKETLQKILDELTDQITHHQVLRDTHLSDSAMFIVRDIDDLFREFNIKVSGTDINFSLIGASWYSFRIQRNSNHNGEGYSESSIRCSSSSDGNEKALKLLICLGKLAEHCFNKTNEWNKLIKLMDEFVELYKVNSSPLYKQFYQIERELNAIDQEEQNKAFLDVFNKGTFKLTNQIRYNYGNGKWDRVYSNEFFWEANESGKTYTVSYTDERRTNPHFDENGNELEAITEIIKRTIDKRIKKADIESFVRQYMNLIAQ